MDGIGCWGMLVWRAGRFRDAGAGSSRLAGKWWRRLVRNVVGIDINPDLRRLHNTLVKLIALRTSPSSTAT